MTPWIRLTAPLTALVLHACVSTPEEVATTSDVASSSGSTTGPVQLTTPGTTMPGEDTMGTQGGTGMDTTMGAADTTVGVSVTDGTTTVDPSTGGSSGGGESSSGPRPECIDETQCENNEICSGGNCVDACGGAWGAGTYGNCLDDLGGIDTANACGANHICLADDHPWSLTACSVEACGSACDCPQPPATGNATVACEELTGDMTNDCYLSCENGETCPDGMECMLDGGGFPLLCATPVPASVPLYGNCDDLAGVACDGGSCGISGSASVCTQGCAGPGNCDSGPAGTMAPQCADVFNPPAGNECFLPCIDAGDCPPGGQCVDVPGSTNACMF